MLIPKYIRKLLLCHSLDVDASLLPTSCHFPLLPFSVFSRPCGWRKSGVEVYAHLHWEEHLPEVGQAALKLE